jgi:hypothetical protein
MTFNSSVNHCRILVARSTAGPMNTLRRFSSFEELKAAEHRTATASTAMVLKRHRAFERLMKALREHIVRSRVKRHGPHGQ